MIIFVRTFVLLSVIFIIPLFVGQYLYKLPRFHKGDCIKSKYAEFWESSPVCRIKEVGNYKYLIDCYEWVWQEQAVIQTTEDIKKFDANSLKVECPKE